MNNPLIRNINICWNQCKDHHGEPFIIDLLENYTTKSDDDYKVCYDKEGHWII